MNVTKGYAVLKRIAKIVLGLAWATILQSQAWAGTITYYHNDLTGSPVAATNEAGQVLWRESYRPYGERLTNSPAAIDSDVWFTSRRQDETGLLYMGARYYDPAIGRFISMDPKGFDDTNLHSHNRYAYANNNPYKFVDLDGRTSFLLVLVGNVVGGAVIGGGTAGVVNAAMQFQSSGTVRWGGIGGVADAAGDGAEVGAVLGVFLAEFGGAAAGANAARQAATMARMSGILRDASAGKGNFGLGRASAAESEALGRAWVGEGFSTASDGVTLVSSDGLSVYRPPSAKPSSPYAETGVQANFERKLEAGGRSISNGHLDIDQ